MEEVHFGTDGWRAIIGEGFTEGNLVRVAEAAAKVFKEDALAAGRTADNLGTIIVGHDCRVDAHRFAALAAEVVAAEGFTVLLTQDYCPTPTLCWSVAHNPEAVGGLMLTSSHNPAEYLGVKLRMADGGASPKEFTDRVEAVLPAQPTAARGNFAESDLMTPYLEALTELVDVEAIRDAGLRVVLDPLFGAGRLYLAQLLRSMNVEVVEIRDTLPTPLSKGCTPNRYPHGLTRAWRKYGNWTTTPCSSTTATPTASAAATARAISPTPTASLP